MSFRNDIVPVDRPKNSPRQIYAGEMCHRVLDLAAEGKFPEEWCAELGATMRTVYAWADKYPEFEEALEAAWHLLHAYWARFLRENMLNPNLRQNAVLQLMAKRFPSTWGREPRNTLEHFLGRHDPEPVENGRSSALQNMSDEELEQRIAALQARAD